MTYTRLLVSQVRGRVGVVGAMMGESSSMISQVLHSGRWHFATVLDILGWGIGLGRAFRGVTLPGVFALTSVLDRFLCVVCR